MKQQPKSCSCQQCKIGKHTKTGQYYRNYDQRKLRRSSKEHIQNERYDLIEVIPGRNSFD